MTERKKRIRGKIKEVEAAGESVLRERTSFTIDTKVRDALRDYCYLNKVHMSEVVETILESYLDQRKDEIEKIAKLRNEAKK